MMIRIRLNQVMTSIATLATAAAVLAFAATATPAMAVSAQQWVHTTEADFVAGTSQNVVVTNLGDVKLATSSQRLEGIPEQSDVIYDLNALDNGDLYIAVGPEAKLLRRRGEQIDTVLTLPDEQIFAMASSHDRRLLLGISGQGSRLAVLDANDQLTDLALLPDVRYIWDIAISGQIVYLATGTDGKVLRINLAQRDDQGHVIVEVVLDAMQSNILCLALDPQGRLFAGSDGEGLIYRITPRGNGEVDVFVVFDAPEPEIGALLVMPDGTLFAGTADARQARPGRLERAAEADAGRPAPVSPPAPVPDAPDMPELPPQVPPEPAPIDQPDAEEQQPKDVPQPQAPAEIIGQEQPEAPPEPIEQLMQRLVDLQAQADAPAAADDGTAAPRPTREQLDSLREVIRQRLEQARQSGQLQAGPPVPTGQPARPRLRPGTSPTAQQPQQPTRPGNAVYRIATDGFVNEVFRESVMILRLAAAGDRLLVATGNEGQLFSVDPVNEETTILIDLEPQQISAVLPGPDGDLLLGTTKPASLVRVTTGFSDEGQYTSAVLDAAQISLWGRLHLTATVPQGTTLNVQTRSGNVQNPEQAAWSTWTEPVAVQHAPGASDLAPVILSIAAPPARFLQYRLNFTSTGRATAVVDRVTIAYVVPNMRPRINSISVGDVTRAAPRPPGAPAPAQRAPQAPQQPGADGFPDPQPRVPIQWDASDPNNDRLIYTLEYRLAGTQRWLLLTENLEANRFEWDTRRVPDGWYVVRVTASDAPDNPSNMAMAATRTSSPVLIDNTAPRFVDVNHQVNGRTARITGSIIDDLTPIAGLQYAVNATDRWLPALPDDLIFDSTQEPFTVTIPHLVPGQHVVTLRARDAQNNAVYRAIVIEVR